MRYGLISFFVLAATVAAQNQLPEAYRKFLPTGAEIIETVDLTAAAGKSRALMLWMEHPLKVERGADAGYCGDLVYGDHWLGPTRLSLVDPAGSRLLNTVKVVGPAFMGDPADIFDSPISFRTPITTFLTQTRSVKASQGSCSCETSMGTVFAPSLRYSCILLVEP